MRLPGSGALKPFVRPQRWLATWWAMVLAVIVGSMLPALLLPHMPAGGDKVQHLLGYAVLGASAVQVFATRRRGRPVIPRTFWVMSVTGSGLLLAYFIWGKNDSVGVLSNLFPMGVAVYNWLMDIRATRRESQSHDMSGGVPSH